SFRQEDLEALVLQLLIRAELTMRLRMNRKPSCPDTRVQRSVFGFHFDALGGFHARPLIYSYSPNSAFLIWRPIFPVKAEQNVFLWYRMSKPKQGANDVRSYTARRPRYRSLTEAGCGD